MNNNFIALIDSGIGGVSTLQSLIRVMPNERYLYFGDNQNAPYGNRTEYDLLTRTIRNVEYLKTFGIKALVLACNTLSVSLHSQIEYYSGVKTFGVYPPVEGACMCGSTLLLCTPLTARKYTNTNNLCVLPLDTLAMEVENNAFNLNNININKVFNRALTKNKTANSLLTDNVKGAFDTVILGCTHFCFLKNKIFDHLRPKNIISGNNFTTRAVKSYLEKGKSQANKRETEVLFVGSCSAQNKKFYEKVVKFY